MKTTLKKTMAALSAAAVVAASAAVMADYGQQDPDSG